MALQWASNSATDFTNLDFGATFQGSSTVTSEPAATIVFPSLDFTIGTTAFHRPSHDLGIDTLVKIEGSGHTTYLWGTGFTFAADGALTGGTITALETWQTATFASDVSLGGFHLDVAVFLAAAHTPATSDDALMVRHLFHGNDSWTGSTESDRIMMGGGKDYYKDGDFGTFDTVFGGAGDDYFAGFDGGRFLGGNGNDLLVNDFTLARLRGGEGHDTLEGGSDRDRMAGGAGADSFLFLADHGHDVVADFTRNADKLVMVNFAASMADLNIVQHGGDTRISFGTWSVLLKNVDSASLTDSDFVFNHPDFLNDGLIAFYTGWDYLP